MTLELKLIISYCLNTDLYFLSVRFEQHLMVYFNLFFYYEQVIGFSLDEVATFIAVLGILSVISQVSSLQIVITS